MSRSRIAPSVGVMDTGSTIYVARLPDGPIHVLVDVAADVWRAVTGMNGADAASGEELSDYLAAMHDAELFVEVDE